jgi:hypothetical protein
VLKTNSLGPSGNGKMVFGKKSGCISVGEGVRFRFDEEDIVYNCLIT